MIASGIVLIISALSFLWLPYDVLYNIYNHWMEYVNQVKSFYETREFWKFHGLGLTVCWLVIAYLSVLIKKRSHSTLGTYIHAALFFVCDVTTIFLAAGAFYNVYPHLKDIASWPLLKVGHVCGGALFSLLVVLQHAGGVAVLKFGANGTPHKKMGMLISTVMRFIAVFGWLVAGKEQIAGLCALAAVVETIIMFVIDQIGKGNATKPTNDNPTKPVDKPKRA
jgi:hypothetical protein